jgi:hypothetical protein
MEEYYIMESKAARGNSLGMPVALAECMVK